MGKGRRVRVKGIRVRVEKGKGIWGKDRKDKDIMVRVDGYG